MNSSLICRTVPKFIKRNQKSIDQSVFNSKLVFGVPLKINFQRHGQPLPKAIIQIMKYLRKNSINTVGIFRKSGSRSRMNLIREHIERTNTFDIEDIERLFSFVNSPSPSGSIISNVDSSNAALTTGGVGSNDLNSIGSGFSSQSTSKSDLVDDSTTTNNCRRGSGSGLTSSEQKQIVNTELISIDLADILKQYFRELPECLFTNKLSQTLIDVFTCIILQLIFLQQKSILKIRY